MQPYYEMPNNTFYHEQKLILDDSILHNPPNTLTPNHIIHHPILQHYHYSQSPQQKQQCLEEYQHFYQSHQQHPGDNIVNRYIQCEGSTARVSFWKAFNNPVLSDATEKEQHEKENEKCLVSDNNFGELEAVYKLGRNQEFIEEHDSKRRTRKKMRKKRLKEEMSLMRVFFKRLTKNVVDHQEVLQNKLLEVIERMEKERIEREENWRREEIEIYAREAIVKARGRDLAKRRESSIVSSIEKITGRRFNFSVKMPSSS